MLHSFDYSGKLLRSGRYRLEQCIGRSKMSSVYRGTDLLLRRPIAVKILHDHLDKEFLLRFQREAHIMACLDHTNIVPIYDYGKQDGLTYLIMPYLTGSLQDDLEHNGSFSLQDACPYIRQIANALDYAHAFHVIHRDLKPANLLFHPDGRLLLTDFGIARVRLSNETSTWSTLTGEGMLIGTPGYIAPETIRGESVDHRADIYALGIIIYQMLSGDIPFQGDTYAVLIQQLHGTFPSLHTLNPTIPSAVDCVIRKATALDPERRYASAGAVAQALQRIAHSRVLPPAYTNLTPASPFATLELPSDEASSPDQSFSSMPQRQQNPSAPLQTNAMAFYFSLTTLLILILLISGFILYSALFRLPVSNPRPGNVTPTPSLLIQKRLAVGAVFGYYTGWNNHDYQAIYSQLEPTYQQAHPYSTLLASYEDTIRSFITIDSAVLLPDGSWKVTITDYADERDPFTEQIFHRMYHGYYIVKKENGIWTLTPHFQYL